MRVIVHYGYDTDSRSFFDPRSDTDNQADAHVVVDRTGCSYVNDVQAARLKARAHAKSVIVRAHKGLPLASGGCRICR